MMDQHALVKIKCFTNVACVDHNVVCLFYAVSSLENKIIIEPNDSNDFVKAPLDQSRHTTFDLTQHFIIGGKISQIPLPQRTFHSNNVQHAGPP